MSKSFVFFVIFVVQETAGALAGDVQLWQRFETAFESAAEYADPLRDVALAVEFTAPSGKAQSRLAFWDGGKSWIIRFAPNEAGKWTYKTRCSEAGNGGLHGKSGEFNCVPYTGDLDIFKHGAIRLSDDRLRLAHADGHPFFWLSCTAWNGALHSTDEAWTEYIADRKAKGFSAVQFVVTQWRASTGDRDGQTAFSGKEKISLNQSQKFFQRLDRKFDELNAAGLLAAPVLLWALPARKAGIVSPGADLPEDQAILLARYLVARYGAHQVLWILAGDGDYRGPKSEKWKRIGRAVFLPVEAEGVKGIGDHSRLVAMHCGGQHWPIEEFRKEAWFDVAGYQSGHGDSEASLRWLVSGPPSKEWKNEPAVAVINMEPNYEAHTAYQSKKPIGDFQVRRAAYWSCLIAPTAGVSYGAHGLWWWSPTDTKEPPLDHAASGVALPWRESIALPGSAQMKHLRDLFAKIWWRLRPAPELLAAQPGDASAAKFIAVAATEKRDWVVCYLPDNEAIEIKAELLAVPMSGIWVDPRNGKQTERRVFITTEEIAKPKPPGPGDWVLVLHTAW